MTDIATLGLGVRQDDVDRASASLQRFRGAAARAEQSARRMGSANDNSQRAARAVTVATGSATAATTAYSAAVNTATAASSRYAGATGALGSALSRIGPIGLAAAAAIGALVMAYRAAVGAGGQAEQSMLRLEGVIKATGGSAGLTGAQINEFALGLGRDTLASADAVRRAAAGLMTFRSIAGDTFKETLRLSQDLAALGFGTLESASMQLAKALEDPATGLNGLRRAGVSFTAAQREMILGMREAGDVAGSQNAILAVLRQQVGGAGTSEAGGLSGAYDTLGENVKAFLENLGNSGPVTMATAAITTLANAVKYLNDQLFPSLERQRSALVESLDRALATSPVSEAGIRRQRDAVDAIYQQIGGINKLIEARGAEEALAQQRAAGVQKQLAAEIAAERARASADAGAAKARSAAEAAARMAASAEEARLQKIFTTTDALRLENEQLGALAAAHRAGGQAIEATNAAIAVQNALIQAGVSIKSADGAEIARLVVANRELQGVIDTVTEAERQRQREMDSAAREAMRMAQEEAQFRKDLLSGTFYDLRYNLEQGKGWWRSFADAGTGAIRRITDALLNELMDAVLKVNGAATGGGGRGGVMGLLSQGLSLATSFFGGSSMTNPGGAYANMGSIKLGEFANGGRPPVGVPSWVGERGRELFVPDTAGTIIPNHRLGAPNHALGGGGGVEHVRVSVVASSEFNAMVETTSKRVSADVVRHHAPKIIGQSVKAVRDSASESKIQ